MCHVPEHQWCITTSLDFTAALIDLATGQKVSSFKAQASLTCIACDADSRHVFLGGFSGEISVVQIEDSTMRQISTLLGHEGTCTTRGPDVRCAPIACAPPA